VFLRERAIGVSVRAYLASKAVVLFGLSVVQTLFLVAILFGLRPLHASSATYLEVIVILLVTSLAAIGIGLLVSTLARSEDQATSFIPLFLIPQILFGGSITPLVGKTILFKLLAGLMLARWAFAGLGAATGLNQSPAVVAHYGSVFSHSVVMLIAVAAIFPAVSFALVAFRLSARRD
jgi:ABC-type transport system involved in multi-copper enzyme maturation permease subunit